MPATTANFSIRLPEETKEKIDLLAKTLGRTRNYLIAEAIERYVEEESWQIAEIRAGIAEDDAGLSVPHDEVMRDAYQVIGQVADSQPS